MALVGFIIMFMEAPNYPVMVLARFVQGISSSVVWVVGLALLCHIVVSSSAWFSANISVDAIQFLSTKLDVSAYFFVEKRSMVIT